MTASESTDAGALPLTGERTVPGVPAENYWFRRHEVAYEFARQHVHGRVLEVGCGEGYGSALLAGATAALIGVDYDAATVRHAARRYPQAAFVRGNLAALPVANGCVDVVLTLQVIEHVWNHPEFVAECRRVLRPGGLLVVSTPNRLTFSPGLDAPINPFHTHEFVAAELVGLLSSGGLDVVWSGGVHAGSRLAALDAAHAGSFVDAQLALPPRQWAARLTHDVASVTTADFVIAGVDERAIEASLDLVVFARRPT